VLIHTGGLGLAHAGLAAGNAQILLPTNLEHQLTSVTLAKLGAAVTFGSALALDSAAIRTAIGSCVVNPAIGERLDQMADLCQQDVMQNLTRVLEVIRAPARGLLASKGAAAK
jgi:hypothetical protein